MENNETLKGQRHHPNAFISYSWDSKEHRDWVKALGSRLRADGVDVALDQWHAIPGDQLTEFMEHSIRENDYVLVVCTPKYKFKSDNRTGGVGYEGDIMTAEVMMRRNHRKFVPLLREGVWGDAAPSWLVGKYYIDFRGYPYSEDAYSELVLTLLNRRAQPPPIGKIGSSSPTNVDTDFRVRRFNLIRDSDKSH